MKRLILAALLLQAFALQAREVPVLESLVVADRCEDQNACSYTWTLMSMSYRAFDMVQERIGPRDKNYQLLGIEFTDGKQPTSWFPGDKEYVIIQLTESTMNDQKQALFQLGHEVFHVVTPTPGGVNVLEEGLATEFSLDFVRQMGFKINDGYINSRSYKTALDATRCLRKFEPDLNKQLQAFRASGKSIGTASTEDLRKALPNTPALFVKALSMHFNHVNVARPLLKSACR